MSSGSHFALGLAALWGRLFLVLAAVCGLGGLVLDAQGFVWLPPSPQLAMSLGPGWTSLHEGLWESWTGLVESVLAGRQPPLEIRGWLATGVPAKLAGLGLALVFLATALLGMIPLTFGYRSGASSASEMQAMEDRQMPRVALDGAPEALASATPPAPEPPPEVAAPTPPSLVEEAMRMPELPPALRPQPTGHRGLDLLAGHLAETRRHVLNASLDLKGLHWAEDLTAARSSLDRAFYALDRLKPGGP